VFALLHFRTQPTLASAPHSSEAELVHA